MKSKKLLLLAIPLLPVSGLVACQNQINNNIEELDQKQTITSKKRF